MSQTFLPYDDDWSDRFRSRTDGRILLADGHVSRVHTLYLEHSFPNAAVLMTMHDDDDDDDRSLDLGHPDASPLLTSAGLNVLLRIAYSRQFRDDVHAFVLYVTRGRFEDRFAVWQAADFMGLCVPLLASTCGFDTCPAFVGPGDSALAAFVSLLPAWRLATALFGDDTPWNVIGSTQLMMRICRNPDCVVAMADILPNITAVHDQLLSVASSISVALLRRSGFRFLVRRATGQISVVVSGKPLLAKMWTTSMTLTSDVFEAAWFCMCVDPSIECLTDERHGPTM